MRGLSERRISESRTRFDVSSRIRNSAVIYAASRINLIPDNSWRDVNGFGM